MSDYMIVNGELYHHGVKGMKWGRRRFQTKDGSLTPAGKKRYSENSKLSRAELEKKAGNFTASNGMKVAPAKNAYTRALRNLSSNRAVENFAVKSYRESSPYMDTATNRQQMLKGERQMRKEAQAIREYNAHVKDLKKGTGTKYLDKAVRANKIDDALEKVETSTTKLEASFFGDSTRRRAAEYVVDNNMSVKDARKKANKEAAAATAVYLGICGAIEISKAYKKK